MVQPQPGWPGTSSTTLSDLLAFAILALGPLYMLLLTRNQPSHHHPPGFLVTVTSQSSADLLLRQEIP